MGSWQQTLGRDYKVNFEVGPISLDTLFQVDAVRRVVLLATDGSGRGPNYRHPLTGQDNFEHF